MNTTTNYSLYKPEVTDPVDITKINDNMDTLDATVKGVSNVANAATPTASIVNDLTTGGATVPASAETVKTLKTQIGAQTYTEDNYVTDGASDTANIDKLDMAVKDNADLISSMISGKTYIFDDFNRADGAIGSAVTGQAWAYSGTVGSAFAIESNLATDGDVALGAAIIAFAKDGVVSVKMPVVSASTGLAARWTDIYNCIRLFNSAGTWKLYKRVSGTTEELASLGAAANNDIIKIRFADTYLQAYVNGVLKASVVCADLKTVVNCGIFSFAGEGTVARWDDFRVEVL